MDIKQVILLWLNYYSIEGRRFVSEIKSIVITKDILK